MKYKFNISKKGLFKNLWLFCILSGTLLLFNGFRINNTFILGLIIILFIISIYNALFCKSFSFVDRTFVISYFFFPFLKSLINIDELSKVIFHYKFKGRDIAYIKFSFKNKRTKIFYFLDLVDSDILEIIQRFKEKGLVVDLK